MKINSLKSSSQSKTLLSIIPEIVRITGPEKILLISASFSTRITENAFIRNPIEELVGVQYSLLVLTGYQNKTLMSQLELMMLAWLSGHGDLQIQLMDIHEFNKKVLEGEEYSITILSNAFVCYDRERIPTEYPGPEYFARA